MNFPTQGYCTGGSCHKFPIIIGEAGSRMSDPSIAPYCPSYNNGDVNQCINNELQVWIWSLRNFIDASIDQFKYMWKGNQLITWSLNLPMLYLLRHLCSGSVKLCTLFIVDNNQFLLFYIWAQSTLSAHSKYASRDSHKGLHNDFESTNLYNNSMVVT